MTSEAELVSKIETFSRETFYSSDLEKDVTVAEFLRELLVTLWKEEEGFSGKRPFGNSGWKHDIIKMSIEKNYIQGEIDADGFVDYSDDVEFDAIVKGAIAWLFEL